jgi:WD40 repeat protein
MKADGRIPGWNSSNSLSDLEDRTLRVWVVDSGAEIPMFAYSGWINALAFHPNGDFLFSAGKELICWDCRNGKRREIFECAVNGGFINCAALSPDGKHFAIGTGGQDEPGAPFQNCFVRVLDSQSGSNVAEMPHRFPVNRLAFSPDGNYVLAGGKFGELHYWPVTA